MSNVLSIHSFRHAAGRSSLAANLGLLLAQQGKRVCIMDTSFQSPGLHLFFRLAESEIECPLNHLLWHECPTNIAVKDKSESLHIQAPGRLLLLPASSDPGDILRMLSETYDPERLNDIIYQLEESYRLDFILMDNDEGLNQNTMMAMAIADRILIVLQPNPSDFQGSAVLVEIAKKLGEQNILMILNDIPDLLDIEQARVEIQKIYQCEVGALLPHSEALMTLASADLLARLHPDEPFVCGIHELTEQLTRSS
jgi:septum site-determining protein MinD